MANYLFSKYHSWALIFKIPAFYRPPSNNISSKIQTRPVKYQKSCNLIDQALPKI